MLALTHGVYRRLATENENNERESTQRSGSEIKVEFPNAEHCYAEGKQAKAKDYARYGQIANAPRIRVRRWFDVVGGQRHRQEITGDHHDDHE